MRENNRGRNALFFHLLFTSWPAVTLFLEFWKRYQAELEYEWDTVEFLEQEEPSRPEYEAKSIYERKNPITGVHHALSFFFHNHRNGLDFSSMVTSQNNNKEI